MDTAPQQPGQPLHVVREGRAVLGRHDRLQSHGWTYRGGKLFVLAGSRLPLEPPCSDERIHLSPQIGEATVLAHQ